MPAPLDKEELKEVYNKNYLQPFDNWTDNNLATTGRIIRRIVRYLQKNGFRFERIRKALDIGCAKGYYTESLRVSGFESYGFDYSDTAIEIARNLFPSCHFFVMDGFDPELSDHYDLIFMKGFSGTNTHDLPFVIGMCNKYIRHLSPEGWLIVAYSTDFSGREKENETANWSVNEIDLVSKSLSGVDLVSIRYFSYHCLWRMVRSIMNFTGIKRKSFFYLVFRKKG